MMRLAVIILLLAATGVALVQLRSAQNAARTEMYRLQAERLRVRRILWQQQLLLGAPILDETNRRHLGDWALELLPPEAQPAPMAMARRN
ncbi:hypothetical protein LCGC14_2652610 [marine sediment metagenome]|uniref:Cell division protein FtsL n=1 Tax=marine sediment metagenome TaxID=412755 RepID=A0A0F8ZUH1_9ZZZZ